MPKLLVAIGGIGLIILVVWLLSSGPPLPEVKNNTIVWLGDSIGSGYGASVGNSPPEYLERQLGLPVINASQSGDTTADGVDKIDRVLRNDPGLMIIQLAGNDALQKLDPTLTETNLRTMIEAFLADGSAVVLVGIRSGPFGDRYGDMFADLASEYELIYIPDALKGLFGNPKYMADPIHPNDAGSEVLASRVYEVVVPIYR